MRRAGDGGPLSGRRAARFYGRELCEPEVEHLHPPVPGDEDVLRLQVAMYHALVMRGRKSFGDLRSVLDGAPLCYRTFLHLFAQGLALQKLADHVRRTLVLPDIVHA